MKCAIKVCGVKSAAFALAAAERGVDYLGFIFEPKSPRYISPKDAYSITRQLPPFVKRVGDFTTQTRQEVESMALRAGVEVLQLHGAYSAADIAAFRSSGYEVWLLDNGATPPQSSSADGLLIDARRGSQVGGTGEVANWSRVKELKAEDCFVILAGGLGPDNIARAAELGADVLDLNSKLETSPGVKSIELLDAALAQLRKE